MAEETGNRDNATPQSGTGVHRRGLLRFGTLITACTGASAISAIGASSAEAGDQTPPTEYVPMSEKGAPLGVATLDMGSKIPPALVPDLSETYATTNAVASAVAPKLDASAAARTYVPPATSFSVLAGSASYADWNFNGHELNNGRYFGHRRLSGAIQNSYVTFLLPWLAPGVWNITIHHYPGTDRGTYFIAVSADGLAWSELGKIDGYVASSPRAARSTITGVVIPERTRFIRVKMESKNASSTGYFGDISMVSGVQTTSVAGPTKNGVTFERAGAKYVAESAEKAWSFTPDKNLDRFEVRNGDKWVNESAGNLANRTELRYTGVPGGGAAYLPFSTDVWLSYGLKIEEGDPITGWAGFGQFHAKQDAGDTGLPPVWALEIVNNTMYVRTRSSILNPTTAAVTSMVHYTAPFARGQWYRFVARLRFEKGTGGHMQFWKDGVEVFNKSILAGYNDVNGPYWKYGIYRQESTATLIASYANVEVGTKSLLARVAKPLPLP